jgi:Flp pilus assembly protein TadD
VRAGGSRAAGGALSVAEPARARGGLGLAAGCALAALAALLYAPALGAPFTLDDHANLVDNAWIRWDGLRLDLLRGTLFEGPTLRPVAYLSFALDHWAHGLDPRGFRAVNVALLVASALLLARLARVLLARLRPPLPADVAQGIAWLAALLYVAHPLQIQSVTYIVQRMTLLAVLFSLASLLAWIRARESAPGRARLGWGALAFGCFALGLGSKEIAIATPAAAWLIEWFFWRDQGRGFARRSLLVVGLPLLALGAVAYAIYTRDFGWGYAGKPFTAGERLLTELRVLVFYLSLFLFPLPSRLNLLHEFTLSRSLLDPLSTLLSLLLLMALAAAGVLLARRAPLVAFALAWALVTLALESFVLPLALAFEHRMALPDVGLCIGAAWALFALCRMRLARAAPVGLACVTALGLATVSRNALWSDEVAFWSDVARKSPSLPAAWNNLGMALSAAGRAGDAEAAMLHALALDGDDAEVLNNLGAQALARGDRAAAAERFRAALAADPAQFRAHFNLGMLLAEDGRLAEAEAELEAALRAAPHEAPLWNGVGALRLLQGRLDDAERALRQALALDPGFEPARENLAALEAQRASR